MKPSTAINLAVEDELSLIVAKRLLAHCSHDLQPGNCWVCNGKGNLRRRIAGFNSAAKFTPYLILADLDREECPPVLLADWCPNGIQKNLIFRVAVEEVEAWLLADREGFARFLGVSRDKIPRNADVISNPKEYVVTLARDSNRRSIKDDVAPAAGVTAKVGPNYNGKLGEFVQTLWDVDTATSRSASLRSAVDCLRGFVPQVKIS